MSTGTAPRETAQRFQVTLDVVLDLTKFKNIPSENVNTQVIEHLEERLLKNIDSDYLIESTITTVAKEL